MVGDVVGVDLLPRRAVGVSADDVLGGEQVVETGTLDGLGELLEEPRVVAEVGVAEGDAEAHTSIRYSA